MAETAYQLGISATLRVIGGKWKPLILCYLGRGPRRPGDLLRLIPPITPKMLTQQLRELAADGIVTRTVFPEVPPHVEYALTPVGRSLRPVLLAMSTWGENRVAEQKAAGACVTISHDHRGFLEY